MLSFHLSERDRFAGSTRQHHSHGAANTTFILQAIVEEPVLESSAQRFSMQDAIHRWLSSWRK
jgi:hypothetical protein